MFRKGTLLKKTGKAWFHPKAVVESSSIGAGTLVWGWSHVMAGARIGKACKIGEQCFVEGGARIGNGCIIKNGVALWDKVTLEDNVFVGPNAAFTNDPVPRAHPRYAAQRSQWRSTRVRAGASVGANATLVCGVTIGQWAFVGAGAVVTKNVPDHGLVQGVPARIKGWVCYCGTRLNDEDRCPRCKIQFSMKKGKLTSRRGPAR